MAQNDSDFLRVSMVHESWQGLAGTSLRPCSRFCKDRALIRDSESDKSASFSHSLFEKLISIFLGAQGPVFLLAVA